MSVEQHMVVVGIVQGHDLQVFMPSTVMYWPFSCCVTMCQNFTVVVADDGLGHSHIPC